LSGGSGKRLWPLSNDIRSKQFIQLFHGEQGMESMVQRVYRQILTADPGAQITIATGEKQVSALRNQLGDKVSICMEPCRRDTFPAIALAAAYLHDEKGLGEDEPVVVCPVDPYVEESYFRNLLTLSELAGKGTANLCLMGVEPTYPSEKYGYIIPETTDVLSPVKAFKEKPDAKTAEGYIAQGALWNCGVFAFRLGYLLDIAHQLIDFTDYRDLYTKYETLQKISFDYAVVEKETDITALRYAGDWRDVGTWNTFTEAMEEPIVGKAVLDETCENTHVINETDLQILCMGCKDMVVAASSDGILVADKGQSSYLKPYADKFVEPARFAEKSWGSYTVLDIQPKALTIRVTLNPGHRMNYHSHKLRDEAWTILSGTGRTVVDGMEQPVRPGDVVTIAAGCKHTIIADTELKLIEVQTGEDIDVNDKEKFPYESL
ncbi:MAG: sugar phosphate nucleotidyltransferase, partial [Anaerotignum sp.]